MSRVNAPQMSDQRTAGGPGHTTRSRRRIALIAAVALLLVVALWLGVTGYRLWRVASALRADLTAAQMLAAGGVENLDARRAADLLHATHADLEELQSAAGPFLWLCPYLGWVPRYGPLIRVAPELLEIAVGLTAAGSEIAGEAIPLLEGAGGEDAPGAAAAPAEAIDTLVRVRPQLLAARSAVDRTEDLLQGLRERDLGPRVEGWIGRLDRYLPLLGEGTRGALLLPDLLGASGPRSYLILIQNEDELRPTGGFISAVARVKVAGGRIMDVQVEDSYAVDDFSQPYPDPPAPLREIMMLDLWVLRDSNWSPDFPTSAQAAADIHAISRDFEPDGVIAVDQQAIRILVAALGPLEVEGFDEPVTGDTVIELARRAWEPEDEQGGDWWLHRKDFMATTLDAAVRRMGGDISREMLISLARAGLQALRQKHLLIYLAEAEGAGLAEDLGWDGAMAQVPRDLQVPRDYLMVVDANVGYNKVNATIQQRIAYTVDLSERSRPRGTLTVTHTNPAPAADAPCNHEPRYDRAYAAMTQRCYWDYLRVYAPLGTQLLDATPHAISGAELLSGKASPARVTTGPTAHGHEVFSTLLLVHRQETLETRFETQLPADVLLASSGGFAYSLRVQKQPGTRAVPLHVRILLPPGSQLVRSEPHPRWVSGRELAYDLRLDTDVVLTVLFESE